MKSVLKLKSFDLLFKGNGDGGYYCCAKTHYKIDLIKSDSILKSFNVDTSSIKGKAIIFDTSFQSSYKIDLEAWKSFLNN